MSNNRKKLEKAADDLGVDYKADTTDEGLQKLINEAQNKAGGEPAQDPEGADGLGIFAEGTVFYKSNIPGLDVQLAEPEDRSDVGVENVRFQPYEFKNKENGEKYKLGLLATDDQDAIDILSEDPEVTEIDENEYRDLATEGEKVAY